VKPKQSITERLPPPPPPELISLHRKFQLVRDLVTGVVQRLKYGLYLWGGGGIGKSYTVITFLDALKIDYRLFNSRMTARGLFYTLADWPDAIHLLEDMERLTRDHDAQGVLRSALWSQPGHVREVTWTTAKGIDAFVFRGGIIMTANKPLANLPELEAVATRIESYHLDPTDAELTALMRHTAAQGYTTHGALALEPDECHDVTEYLLAECRAAGCPLDLRLQHKSYKTYLQWDQGLSVTHWHDLVAASVRETAHHFRHPPESALGKDRRRCHRNILRAILAQTNDTGEQLRLYREQTGASRADFFRKKHEVQSGDYDAEDSSSD
jgi:hypothetical protein